MRRPGLQGFASIRKIPTIIPDSLLLTKIDKMVTLHEFSSLLLSKTNNTIINLLHIPLSKIPRTHLHSLLKSYVDARPDDQVIYPFSTADIDVIMNTEQAAALDKKCIKITNVP
eukprot:UN08565